MPARYSRPFHLLPLAATARHAFCLTVLSQSGLPMVASPPPSTDYAHYHWRFLPVPLRHIDAAHHATYFLPDTRRPPTTPLGHTCRIRGGEPPHRRLLPLDLCLTVRTSVPSVLFSPLSVGLSYTIYSVFSLVTQLGQLTATTAPGVPPNVYWGSNL